MLVAPAAIGSAPGSSTTETVTPLAATDVTTTGGTADYLPIFSGAATIIDSSVFQTGSGTTGKIGIDTITPATQLDVNGAGTIRGTLSLPATGVATSAGGKNSQGLNIVASSFSSTSSTALNQVFRWQAEPAANDTTSPTGTLNLQYGLGTATPTETGLKVSSKGVLTFATGQTFPRTGTITGITTATGSGLTGGGTSGTLSLKVPAAGITNAMLATSYAQLGAANTFTANETVNGTITANSSTNAIVGNSSGTSGYGVEGSGNSNGVVRPRVVHFRHWHIWTRDGRDRAHIRRTRRVGVDFRPRRSGICYRYVRECSWRHRYLPIACRLWGLRRKQRHDREHRRCVRISGVHEWHRRRGQFDRCHGNYIWCDRNLGVHEWHRSLRIRSIHNGV